MVVAAVSLDSIQRIFYERKVKSVSYTHLDVYKRQILARGIPIVVFDSYAPEGMGLTTVNNDFVAQQIGACQRLVDLMKAKEKKDVYKVALIEGVPTAPNHKKRFETSKEFFSKLPEIEIVAEGVDKDVYKRQFQGEVIIRKEMFHYKEMELVKGKALKASLFIFESGIHAVKLENELGYITAVSYTHLLFSSLTAAKQFSSFSAHCSPSLRNCIVSYI